LCNESHRQMRLPKHSGLTSAAPDSTVVIRRMLFAVHGPRGAMRPTRTDTYRSCELRSCIANSAAPFASWISGFRLTGIRPVLCFAWHREPDVNSNTYAAYSDNESLILSTCNDWCFCPHVLGCALMVSPWVVCAPRNRCLAFLFSMAANSLAGIFSDPGVWHSP
jgi:hypothetical protein